MFGITDWSLLTSIATEFSIHSGPKGLLTPMRLGNDPRGSHVCVAQQIMDRASIVARLKQVHGETVTKRMGEDPHGNPRSKGCPFELFSKISVVDIVIVDDSCPWIR